MQKLLTVILILISYSCSTDIVNSKTIKIRNNQEVVLSSFPSDLDTVFLNSYNEGVYSVGNVTIKTFAHHSINWTVESNLRKEACAGNYLEHLRIHCYKNVYHKFDNLIVNEQSFFSQENKVFLKSWIWNIEDCEYYISIEVNDISFLEIQEINGKYTLNKLSILKDDNRCSDLGFRSELNEYFSSCIIL